MEHTFSANSLFISTTVLTSSVGNFLFPERRFFKVTSFSFAFFLAFVTTFLDILVLSPNSQSATVESFAFGFMYTAA